MTNEPKAGMGLDPEMLAAYIDNRLPPEQRAVVEAQLASDPDSYAVLVETMKALDEGSVPEVRTTPVVPEVPSSQAVVVPMPPRVPKTRWVVAGSVLAVAAATVLVVWLQPEVWQRIRGGEPVDPLMAKLVEAVGEERYIEARLTGGFKFGPLRSVTRGPGDLSRENLALLAAAGELQQRVGSNPSPEDLNAWGVAQLLLGDYEAAVRDLEEASLGNPQSADFLADLAAAYAARASSLGRETDWPRALDAAERAIVLDRPLVEPWFTRAIVVEKLGLDSETAWRQYLQLDSSSPWAAEARSRLQGVERKPRARTETEIDRDLQDALKTLDASTLGRLIDAAPERVRAQIEEKLTADWGRAILDRSAAAGILVDRQLSVLVPLYRARVGDSMPDSVLRHLRSLTTHKEREALARAMVALSAAVSYVREDRFSDADVILDSIRPTLKSSGSPLALSAGYYSALSLSQRGQLSEALGELASIRRECTARNYTSLCGTVINREGQIHSRLGDRQRALADRRAAMAAFEVARNQDQVAVMHSMMAESYRVLSDPVLAWQHHLKSLDRLPQVHDFRSRHNVLVQAGLTSASQGLHEAALLFQLAVLRNGQQWERASSIATGFLQSARSLARLGRSAEALGQLRAAREWLAGIPDHNFRERIELEVLEAEGELFGSGDPVAGIPVLDRAIDRFEHTGFGIRLSRLFLARGRLHESTGDIDSAERDWLAGIDRLESERAKLTEEQLRLSQAGHLRELRLRLALLRRGRGDPPLSVLAMLDLARARSLIDEASPGVIRADLIATLQHELPPNVGLLYFVTDAPSPFVYLMTRDRIIERGLAQDQGSASKHLLNYRRVVDTRATEPEFVTASERLYQFLLAPLNEELKQLGMLIVVPDGRLGRVSFAALRNPLTKRFLIEDFDVAVAPAGALLIAPQPSRVGALKAVVVAGESRGSGSFPPLPWVAREVEEISNSYGHDTRTGALQPSEFLKAIATADIVHFAGHAVASATNPSMSRLLLEVDGSTSDLYAYQLAAGPRLHAALVVLAACRTGHSDGESSEDDAALSLARPFLARGAAAVLASLWDVSDRHSADLMPALHRRIAAGETPASAWRTAVLGMVKREESIQSWAPYTIYLGNGGLPLSATKNAPTITEER